jgi:hypothetical protein
VKRSLSTFIIELAAKNSSLHLCVLQLKSPPKGKDLERAVRLLQEALLQNDSALKGGKFTVEVNKILVLNRTRHEVDVYVVTNPGTQYESVVLFECKDWNKSVSKNEVMNLKEKVDLLGANRGILVAHNLSKDAESLLAGYNRIRFQRCSQDFRQLLGLDILHTVHDPVRILASVTSRTPNQTLPPNFLHGICRWRDRISLFEAVARQRVDRLVFEDQRQSAARYSTESEHWFEAHEVLDFDVGEFFIGEVEIARLQMSVAYFVSVMKATPRYQCSIDGAGQVHFFEFHSAKFPESRFSLEVIFT